MFQHLDDLDAHELPPAFRSDVIRRAAQIRRRRASAGACIILVVVVGFAAGALAWVNKRDGDIQRVHLADGALVAPVASEPIDIVLVGIDATDRAEDTDPVYPSRADAILLVRFDPASGSLRLLSFPRDLRDPRTGRRFDDTSGNDPSSIVASVNLMVPVPVHHYVELDFSGFAALVDEFGGVRMASSAPIRDAMTGLSLPSGCSTLDGMTALAFVRARHLEVDGVEDPRGDLGRIDRQQTFVGAVLAQLRNAATDPLALDRYARILGDHAVLDDTFDLPQLIALAKQLRSVDAAKVAALTFPSTMINVDGRAMLEATPDAAEVVERFLTDSTLPEPDGETPPAPPLAIVPC